MKLKAYILDPRDTLVGNEKIVLISMFNWLFEDLDDYDSITEISIEDDMMLIVKMNEDEIQYPMYAMVFGYLMPYLMDGFKRAVKQGDTTLINTFSRNSILSKVYNDNLILYEHFQIYDCLPITIMLEILNFIRTADNIEPEPVKTYLHNPSIAY